MMDVVCTEPASRGNLTMMYPGHPLKDSSNYFTDNSTADTMHRDFYFLFLNRVDLPTTTTSRECAKPQLQDEETERDSKVRTGMTGTGIRP